MLTIRPIHLLVFFFIGNVALFGSIHFWDTRSLSEAAQTSGLLLGKMLGTVGLILLATALGRRLLRKARIQSPEGLELPIFFGIGMLTLGSGMFALAALQSISLPIVVGVLLAIGYFCRNDLPLLWQSVIRSTIPLPLIKPWLIVIWLSLAIIFELTFILSAANILGADYDSFHQYLTFPMEYLRHGGLTVFLWHPSWGFPQIGEMIFLLSATLFGISGPFFINWAFFIILTATLFRGMKATGGSTIRHWLTACFVSGPTILFLGAGHLKIELILFFYCLLALLITLELLKSGHQDKGADWHLPILLGIIFGALLSIKYTSFFILAGIISGLWLFSKEKKRSFGHISLAIVISIAVFSPWLIKNWIVYESPLYPILRGHDQFFLETGAVSQGLFKQYAGHDVILALSQHLQQTGLTILDNLRILLLSLTPLANTLPTPFPGIWVLACLLIAGTICLRWKNIDSSEKFLLFFLGSFTLLWLPFLLGGTWYLFPAWLALLLFIAQRPPESLSETTVSRLLMIITLPTLIVSFSFFSPSSVVNSIRYANGDLPLQEAIVRDRRDPSLVDISNRINTLLREDSSARVYSFQEPRGYFIDDSSERFILDYYGDKFNSLERIGSLRESLQALGVRYVFVNDRRQQQCDSLRQPEKNGICRSLTSFRSSIEQEVWSPIFTQGYMTLYEL